MHTYRSGTKLNVGLDSYTDSPINRVVNIVREYKTFNLIVLYSGGD
jgi:hypothetical protein